LATRCAAQRRRAVHLGVAGGRVVHDRARRGAQPGPRHADHPAPEGGPAGVPGGAPLEGAHGSSLSLGPQERSASVSGLGMCACEGRNCVVRVRLQDRAGAQPGPLHGHAAPHSGGAAGAPGKAMPNGAALCAYPGAAEVERVWSLLDEGAQLGYARVPYYPIPYPTRQDLVMKHSA